MKKTILSIIIVLLTVVGASAQSYIAQGEVGTCIWYITNEGELVIAPADGVSGDLSANGWSHTGNSDYYTTAPWGEYRDSIYSAKIMTGVNARSCKDMFSGLSKMETIDLSNFNTQNVTSMSYMFGGCSSLTSLDLSNFNTQNVTGMYRMFEGCSSLTSLDLSNFNTQNVMGMDSMFSGCSSLTSLDLSNFNTENVKYMWDMFKDCNSLTTLDLSNFNTQNVTEMDWMFDGCSSLTSLDLSNFNTQNVTYMGGMFDGCSSLTSLDLGNFNTQNVTSMDCMFRGCSSLTSLDLSNFNTENVTSMSYMFCYCSSLTSIDLSNFNTENVTNMYSMFYGCSSLTSLDLSNFNTQNVTDMYGMFYGCNKLTTIISNTVTPSPLTVGTFESFENRNNCTLIVPAGTKALYAAADGWNELGMIDDGTYADDVYGTQILALTSEEPFYNSDNYKAERVTYTRNFTKETPKGGNAGWETIVLPFDVQKIATADGRRLAPFGSFEVESGMALPFWLAEYTEDGTFRHASKIRANVPYIIAMPNSTDYNQKYCVSGTVTFAAQNAEISKSENAISIKSSGYTFTPAYNFVEPASNVFAINHDIYYTAETDYLPGSVFAAEIGTVKPFEAYLRITDTNAANRRYIPIVTDNGVADGIYEVLVNTDAANGKFLENSKLVIRKNGAKYNATGIQIK